MFSYKCNMFSKVQKFKDYTDRDRKDAQTIDAQMKRLLRLQAHLFFFRL